MDWDELEPKAPAGQSTKSYALGSDLSKHSIEELRALIESLREEIARAEAAMSAKQSSKSAAEAAFKS
jgi:uncharacterized small protein (DUF1192 family)